MNEKYKKLNIDRDKIIITIKNYCEMHDYRYTISDTYEKSGTTRNRLRMTIDDKSLYLDFHFNNDGSTTIDNSGGQYLDIKNEICLHIIDNCIIGNSLDSNQWFVVKGVREEDFYATLDLIKESTYYQETISEDSQKFKYKYKGIYGESLTIT